MATKSIVPRADNEGSLGTESKRWNNIQTVKLNNVEMPIDPPTIEDAGKSLCLNFDGSGYEYRNSNLPLITENDANKILAVKSDSSDVEWVAADYAPLESPALTGNPTAPTAPSGTSTEQIATTKFVKDYLDSVGEEHGSYPALAKNAMTLEDTLWVNSKYGITWNDAGYLTVFETLAKTLLHPDSLYLRQDDPDMLGDLVIGGSATIKYDRKRNRLNICASGESAVVYSDDPVHIDGDTCGPVTLLNGVTLAVNVGGDLALTVSGVPETAPPDTFLSSGTYKELLHIGSGVAVTNIEFIEVDSPVSLAADAYGIYSAEFIEDETVTYSKFSLGAATFPNMKEVA